MSRLVSLGYVPALLTAALAVVIVLCKRSDARVEAAEAEARHRERDAEQQGFDDAFLDIVTTQLADLEVRRERDE